MSRQRDIQYSSRSESHLERQMQIHRLRHVIRELGQHIAEDKRDTAAVKGTARLGLRHDDAGARTRRAAL